MTKCIYAAIVLIITHTLLLTPTLEADEVFTLSPSVIAQAKRIAQEQPIPKYFNFQRPEHLTGLDLHSEETLNQIIQESMGDLASPDKYILNNAISTLHYIGAPAQEAFIEGMQSPNPHVV